MAFPPQRIICLTEETVETLYLLGQQDRIVGISGYAVRPPGVRREKPRVSAFTCADLSKVMALAPDLVFTFSDLQAGIAAALLREGVAVYGFNQRSLAGIFDMIETLGALTRCEERAKALTSGYRARLAALRTEAPARGLKVYFEEWDEPMISGIGWVSELIEATGATDVFAHLAREQAATSRIVAPEQVIAAAPDVILASWCGRRVRPERIATRPGWQTVPAVARGRIHEIKSPLILQPGSAALTEGLDALVNALLRGRLQAIP